MKYKYIFFTKIAERLGLKKTSISATRTPDKWKPLLKKLREIDNNIDQEIEKFKLN